jgi:hypothetical protein
MVFGIPKEEHWGKRPIYGSLLFNPYQTGGASTYGQCWATLKPHVHERTTLTPDDSFGARSDQVFKKSDALHLFRGSGYRSSSTVPLLKAQRKFYGYVEAQVHGGVDLAKDVESIHIPYDPRWAEWANDDIHPKSYREGYKADLAKAENAIKMGIQYGIKVHGYNPSSDLHHHEDCHLLYDPKPVGSNVPERKQESAPVPSIPKASPKVRTSTSTLPKTRTKKPRSPKTGT